MVCTKQFSSVIQTFERTYKSLITAAYCLGLHNSISFYIYLYIFLIAGSSQAFIFVLPGPKCIKVYPKRQLQIYNKLYTNRRQFLRFLDRLHCLKMLWYEHLVQLLCFYPPTASSRALMKFSSCLDLRSPNCCKQYKQDPRLRVAEHAEDWGILICLCLWLTCDWIKTEFCS